MSAIFVAASAEYLIGQFAAPANSLADALTAIPASRQGVQLVHQRQQMIQLVAATKSFKKLGSPKVAKVPAPPAGTVTPVYAPIPSPGTAQAIAYQMLWTRESGWRVNAANASGAYGIPQALPGSKMATAGSDWQTSASTQIKWGLGYIKERYGSPCNAWAFWEGHGWY